MQCAAATAYLIAGALGVSGVTAAPGSAALVLYLSALGPWLSSRR
jgi:hypothetical protein